MARGAKARSFFDIEYANYPSSFTAPLKESITKGLEAYDKFARGKSDMTDAMNGGLQTALRDLAEANEKTFGDEYKPAIRRLLSLRGVYPGEWVDQQANLGLESKRKPGGAFSSFAQQLTFTKSEEEAQQKLLFINLDRFAPAWWETPIRFDWNNPRVQDDVYGSLTKSNPRLYPENMKASFVDRQRKLNSQEAK